MAAFFGVYVFAFLFKAQKMGIEPVTSITANKMTKALINCWKLNWLNIFSSVVIM